MLACHAHKKFCSTDQHMLKKGHEKSHAHPSTHHACTAGLFGVGMTNIQATVHHDFLHLRHSLLQQRCRRILQTARYGGN